ncbi:MAG: hypothetical protein AAGB29_13415 [Planctomycetota bacterium]
MEPIQIESESGWIEQFERVADRARRLYRLRSTLGEAAAGRAALNDQIREAESAMRSIGRRLRRSA